MKTMACSIEVCHGVEFGLEVRKIHDELLFFCLQ